MLRLQLLTVKKTARRAKNGASRERVSRFWLGQLAHVFRERTRELVSKILLQQTTQSSEHTSVKFIKIQSNQTEE